MMQQTMITVAIPLYNHAKYIETCLDSVIAQQLPQIEILLIDDGSKDESFQVAKQWESRHRGQFVRTSFEKQENQGITRTIDRLIRKSQGQYVLILASDDVLLPGSIEKRLECFADPSISSVFGDAIPIDEMGLPLGQSAIGELGVPSDREALSDPRTLLWELVFRWNIYGSVFMARRNALVGIDGRSILNTSIYSEDMQLYYRMAGQNSLFYLNEPVAGYRIHVGSTCRTVANLNKLRKNIFESRKYSSQFMKIIPRCVVLLQALTYWRWRGGVIGLLCMPFVIASYCIIFVSKNSYDIFRKKCLGHVCELPSKGARKTC